MSDAVLNIAMLAKGKVRVDLFGLIGPAKAGMIDTQMVNQKLSEAGDLQEIELHINSKGGDAFEGIGIYNLLKSHPARKKVVVHGIAASAASVVAMAGDEIHVPRTASLMVHEPYTFAFGGRKDLSSRLKALEAVQQSTVEIYSARTKQTPEKIAELMQAETYMSGAQAVEMGFADATDKSAEPAGEIVQQVAVEDCQSQFLPLLSIAMSAIQEPQQMADNPTPTPAAEPTPAPTPVVVPAAPQLTAADVQKAANDAVAAERSRISSIQAVCQKAGKPEAAQQYIDSGAELLTVQNAMFDVLCAARPPVGDAGGSDIQQQADPEKQWKADYAADRAIHMRNGVTEEDYIASQKISAGLEPLVAR